jgi:hypothetical protein
MLGCQHPIHAKTLSTFPLSTPQSSNILGVQTRKNESSSFDVRDKVSHLYKTFNIAVSYTFVSVPGQQIGRQNILE